MEYCRSLRPNTTQQCWLPCQVTLGKSQRVRILVNLTWVFTSAEGSGVTQKGFFSQFLVISLGACLEHQVLNELCMWSGLLLPSSCSIVQRAKAGTSFFFSKALRNALQLGNALYMADITCFSPALWLKVAWWISNAIKNILWPVWIRVTGCTDTSFL